MQRKFIDRVVWGIVAGAIVLGVYGLSDLHAANCVNQNNCKMIHAFYSANNNGYAGYPLSTSCNICDGGGWCETGNTLTCTDTTKISFALCAVPGQQFCG